MAVCCCLETCRQLLGDLSVLAVQQTLSPTECECFTGALEVPGPVLIPVTVLRLTPFPDKETEAQRGERIVY